MSSTIVLITGANSGVGFAAAKVIASSSENFRVIISSRVLSNAENAKSEIEAAGVKGQLSTVQLDVTSQSSVEEAVAHVARKFGRLDVLVNNAGVGNRDPDVRTRFQQCMDVNVVGPAVVAEMFRPLLFKSEKPYSIFVSSGAGSMGRANDPSSPMYRGGPKNGAAYRASKAALNMIALQESIEFSDTALKVFALCPGFVVSNLRGKDEDARNGWGRGAGDPQVSGELILSVIQGKRDADVGQFVYRDGVYPW